MINNPKLTKQEKIFKLYHLIHQADASKKPHHMSLQSLSLFQWLHESNKHYTKFHQRFFAKIIPPKEGEETPYLYKKNRANETLANFLKEGRNHQVIRVWLHWSEDELDSGGCDWGEVAST